MQNTIYTPPNRATDLEFLTRLNTMLSTNHHYQENINTILAMVGRYIQDDRIYIFEIQHDATVSILYEWHDKELKSIQDQFQHQKIIIDKTLERQLYAEEHITIDETDELINQDIKTLLTKQDGKKTILFPLIESGTQFAFIAFTQCQQKYDWDKEDIQLMKIIASIVAINLHKNFLIEKLYLYRSNLKKSEQRIKILETQLHAINQQLQPEWQQLRGMFQKVETNNIPFPLDTFDKHLYTLNRLCQHITIK